MALGFLFLCGCGDDGTPRRDPAGESRCRVDGQVGWNLRPISSEHARAMAAYVRQTRVWDPAAPETEEMPVSWSRLNSDCEKRMVAVQVVLSSTAAPAEAPWRLVPADLGEENLSRLRKTPAIQVGGVGVYGRLRTRQRLLDYDRTPASEATLDLGWPMHFIALLNVEGTCKVMDLSAGDDPLEIPAWLSGFAEGGCAYRQDAALAAAPPPGEEDGCSYAFLGPFEAAILDDPTRIPGQLRDASSSFPAELQDDFGIPDPRTADLPFYLTEYTARPPEP